MSSFDGILTIPTDTGPSFIQVRDLDTFWNAIAEIHRDRFNESGNVTLDAQNIIIGDKTYKGPVVLTPEDIENKSVKKLIA